MPESGFTLVEIVIAVAIVATTVAAGFGISLASRSLAVSTAAGEFDQFLDSARTMARDLDGATLAFTADAYGDGTEVRLFAGGPNGPPAPTTLPTLHARATIEEAESLGKAPFAFIVHANGSLSGRPNYRIGDTTTNDVGCPASGAFHFVIKAAGGSADRYVPCRLKLAANGPVTLTAWPLASPAPSPTPCSSGPGCSATSLPSVPTSTASCPPNFTAIPGGCAPVPPSSSGARYHVTVTGAPATLTVGATASVSAQATLTNPNAVSSGTPVSIPVSIQSADMTCTATPPGWQQSGTSFAISGKAVGTCTLTVMADPSGVAGASSDTATATTAIAAVPVPTPTSSATSCDVAANGKCYHRIVGEANQTFWKYVLPDTSCLADGSQCFYSDSIRQIVLEPAYGFRPLTAAVDGAHELLFEVEKVISVYNQCQPYSYFAGVPAGDSIQWGGSGIGSPMTAAFGWGQPSIYSTVNHVLMGGPLQSGSLIEGNQSWTSGTTLRNLFDAVASGQIGQAYRFSFSSSADTPDSYVQWYPDFAGCDAAGDSNRPGIEYGISGVELVFQIYQAVP